ncbi:Guanylate kinase [hydrothermal vent metagenome]|uniref:guanylate kinase n=1 Tax=hydrothermal vent metagenome TaxID=652676 RepID=A0A1W1EIA4_9ZZZZ
MRGAILVLSGPSGAGKSTIISASSKAIGSYYFSISTTTREPREGEVDGVDYHFVSKMEFEEDIKAGHFLEYATVHNNYYGTSIKPVQDALDENKLVIFDIDIQGHRLVRAKLGDIITSAFITPPTLRELENRLRSRCSDSNEIITQRVENAKDEIKAISEYDFMIINDDIEKASKEFTVVANSARLKHSKIDLNGFIDEWLIG